MEHNIFETDSSAPSAILYQQKTDHYWPHFGIQKKCTCKPANSVFHVIANLYPLNNLYTWICGFDTHTHPPPPPDS